MNTIIKNALLWVCGLLLVSGLLAWRYFTPPPPTAQIALLDDRSRSMPDDCEALTALGQRILNLPNLRQQSTLTLFATTDADPALVANFKLPTGRLSTESRRRQADREKAFLAGLQKQCQSSRRAQTSPIYRSIKQVMAHLRTLNGQGQATLHLFVRTDLLETADSAIKKALEGTAGNVPSALSPIDNSSILLTICGFAESGGASTARKTLNTDRLIEVWRALFTQPDLVRFEPYCAKLPSGPELSR